MVGQSSPEFDKIRPKLPKLGQSWPDFGDKSAEFAQTLAGVGEMQPRLVKAGASFTEGWPSSTQYGKSWPESGQFRPNMSNIGRCLSNVAHAWPKLSNQIQAKIGQRLPEFGPNRMTRGTRRAHVTHDTNEEHDFPVGRIRQGRTPPSSDLRIQFFAEFCSALVGMPTALPMITQSGKLLETSRHFNHAGLAPRGVSRHVVGVVDI